MQQLSENFWNIRGTMKLAKVVDMGTHMSLVRRANGRFILLDSYDVSEESRAHLLRLTDNGTAVDAILNVHPFHTLHCRAAHELAPSARLFGTRRHRQQAPDLPWESGLIEEEKTQAEFSEDLEFSLPAGVDLVTEDNSVHAGSVLVRHKASGIVHVDDTLNVLDPPGLLGKVLPESRLKFHPMLGKALQPRPGAADAYAEWAQDLAARWAGTPLVCAAHNSTRKLSQDGWRDEILHALEDVSKTLDKHRGKYD
ncbi:hypothetical protein GCM10007989_21670 [Devosia pacifica]|uniref:Metallo-beta-lactamase domain-containing protein n=1 Tax=Devosia pacifica TaxID=1335967 RepID=A0A918S6J2_9HYPH|nr:hypothetical protein [Devosia pacifica]GHA25648.1 hypothetical protein GCM10007989_21670 [Devosia pacifica]